MFEVVVVKHDGHKSSCTVGHRTLDFLKNNYELDTRRLVYHVLLTPSKLVIWVRWKM